MKKALCILTALFAISWASAQTSSSQSQTGGSSDQSSMSSSKQGTQEKGMKKGGKKETTLTGCLSGPNAEGNYELQHGAKKVEVASSEDLKAHVGHTVKLHGSYVKAAAMEKGEASEKGEAAEKGGMEKGGMKEEKGERHFQVTSIDHISDTCKGGAMGKGEHKMNHKMKKGEMGEGGEMSPSPSPTPSPK
jgi:hypothetical protein